MQLEQFVKGLELLSRHFERDKYPLTCEHDQFYVAATETPLDSSEVQRLRELGWFQPEIGEERYDPEEPWSAFV